MEEIWKDIKGYENLYQVSNLGNIKSLKKLVNCGIKINSKVFKKEKNLKYLISGTGYPFVTLYKNKIGKMFLVHRLVAETFIPNPNNYKIVNHIDENPKNCNVNNLEWCTQSYNINFGTRNEKIAKKLLNNPINSKKVIQKDLNNNVIKVWESLSEIERKLKFSRSSIAKCCKEKDKISHGYKWEFYKKEEG